MLVPLPEKWITSLFARLQVRYGSSWSNKWLGIDPADVQADWAEMLAGYAKSPESISHGLDNLPPDIPPNAAQFAALCRNAPRYQPLRIEAPRGDPTAALMALRALARPKGHNPKAWAYRLRDRDQKTLTGAQRSMWRAALTPELARESAERPELAYVERMAA